MPHCECVNVRPIPMKTSSRQNGYALLIVLMALLAAAVMVPVFAKTVYGRVQTSAKAQRQDLAAAVFESRYAELRAGMRSAMARAATVTFDSADDSQGIVQTVIRGGNESYSLTATATPGIGSNGDALNAIGVIPWAWAGERGLRSYAGMPDNEIGLGEMLDDPFFGTPADVWPITVDATLAPTIQAVSNTDTVPLTGQLRLAVRRMPASAFTLASMGNATINKTTSEEGSGRVYARRTLSVTHSATASAKMVVGQAMNVAEGARLDLTWSGGQMTVEGPMRTDSSNWSAMRQTYAGGPMPVTTGRETPVNLIQQFPLASYLEPAIERSGTPVGSPVGSPIGAPLEPPSEGRIPVWEAAKFEAYSSLIVKDVDGTLQFSGPLSSQSGVSESCMYYVTTRHVGGRIVRIDLASLAAAAAGDVLGTNVRISVVVQANSNTSVLLVNGEAATADISVATPLPVYIAGGLNQDSSRATSVVTTARVSSVLAEF